MKPTLGRTVYCIYMNDINQEEVGYLGKDSFIVDDFSELRRLDSLEYLYDDYQKTWFTSFARAKKAVLAELYRLKPNEKHSIKKVCDGYWSSRGE